MVRKVEIIKIIEIITIKVKKAVRIYKRDIKTKRLKGIYVVENSVIVPLFTLIIVAVISLCCYMHDKVVAGNIMEQVCIECSRQDDKNEQNVIMSKARNYIETKTLFLKNIRVYMSGNTGKETVTCIADCGLTPAFLSIKAFTINKKISYSHPPKLIRITNAIKEAIN
ncbi:MAG: hypothetical protein Q4F06_04340 [Eubacteriales bacterium]|nr:hypothetical protein [Eubacteriales bacterium]